MYFVVEKIIWNGADQCAEAEILLENEAVEKGYCHGYNFQEPGGSVSVEAFEELDEALNQLIKVLDRNYDFRMPAREKENIISVYKSMTQKKEIKKELDAQAAGYVPAGAPQYAGVQPKRYVPEQLKPLPADSRKKTWPWIVGPIVAGLLIVSIIGSGNGKDAKAEEKAAAFTLSEAGEASADGDAAALPGVGDEIIIDENVPGINPEAAPDQGEPEGPFVDREEKYDLNEFLYDSDAPKEPTEETAAYEFTVGDTQEIEPGLFLTLNGVRFDTDGFFSADGVYVILDCTYENKTGEDVALSTLLTLHIKDEDDYKHSVSIGAETKGSLDGILADGDRMRGEAAFDVPVGTGVAYFYYEPFSLRRISPSKWWIGLVF